jgi:hypothetical protein
MKATPPPNAVSEAADAAVRKYPNAKGILLAKLKGKRMRLAISSMG